MWQSHLLPTRHTWMPRNKTSRAPPCFLSISSHPNPSLLNQRHNSFIIHTSPRVSHCLWSLCLVDFCSNTKQTQSPHAEKRGKITRRSFFLDHLLSVVLYAVRTDSIAILSPNIRRSFQEVPVEILLQIFGQIDGLADRANLSRSCHASHRIFLPVLYSSFFVSVLTSNLWWCKEALFHIERFANVQGDSHTMLTQRSCSYEPLPRTLP